MPLPPEAVFGLEETAGVGLEFLSTLLLTKRKAGMEPLVLNKLRCGGSAVKFLHAYPWFELVFLDFTSRGVWIWVHLGGVRA
jgi:hypothetical protein